MPKITASPDWQTMVLRSMPSPKWLAEEGPDSDIAISTRVRYARNLVGFPFPHHSSRDQLLDIRNRVTVALEPLRLFSRSRLSSSEREFMVGARLMAPDFEMSSPGRALLHSPSGDLSVMVNEEDHVRIQGLQSGWQLAEAERPAKAALKLLEGTAPFAYAREVGYLTASPYNAGVGRRISVLLHLVGLAHTGSLRRVLKASTELGLVVRGVFGESTRGVGAFIQVSWTGKQISPFVGSVQFLVKEERSARAQVPSERVHDGVRAAAKFAVESTRLPLADVLRVLAYARWAAHLKLPGAPESVKQVDHLASTIEIHGRFDPDLAAESRAQLLRGKLEKLAY